jgi:LmbE family N-acetylglucosaminyl deacetylase
VKVVVLAPHPDDEVLGCGGTMARHSAQGDEVHIVVVTRGITELFPPAEIEGTRAELARAHEILGVSSTVFMDLPAPRLDMVPRHEIADGIRKRVRDIAPDIVYLPHHGDLHHDHGAVYFAALVALRPTPAWTPTLLTYETLSETDWAPPTSAHQFIPTTFVDITATLSTKLEAMRCFASQLKGVGHPRSLRALTALAELRGATVGVGAAEAFADVRRVVGAARALTA